MKRIIYFAISIIIIVIFSLHCYNILNLDNNILNKIESFKGESNKIESNKIESNKIESNKIESNKIAFCFLTINDVKHADIWKQYFEYNKNKYNIYIHPKNINEVNSFFKQFIIKKNIKTKWGDISLTDATYFMIIEALKDPANHKIILVSDSCIPIKSFDFTYKRVMSNNKSWFNYYKPSPENSLNHFWRISKLPEFLKEKAFIQEQWMILDRKHAIIIKNNYTKYRKYINKTKLMIPDEFLFITILSNIIPNIKNELQFPEHSRDQFKQHNYITFANWYNYGELINSFHPLTYNKIEINDIIQLKKSDAFFARKFSLNSDIKKYWLEIVTHEQTEILKENNYTYPNKHSIIYKPIYKPI